MFNFWTVFPAPPFCLSNPEPPPGGLAHGHPTGAAKQNLTPTRNSPPARPQDKWSISGPLPINRHKDKNIVCGGALGWGLTKSSSSPGRFTILLQVVYSPLLCNDSGSSQWRDKEEPQHLSSGINKDDSVCLTRQLWGVMWYMWHTWHTARTQQLYSAHVNTVGIIIMFLTNTYWYLQICKGHEFLGPVQSIRQNIRCAVMEISRHRQWW